MQGWLLLLATVFLLAIGGAAEAAKRVALVVGNGAYEHTASLANPVNDANDMTELLEEMGFSVTRLLDADEKAMQQGLIAFAREAEGADVALFFYAGHGVQMGGENYLLPTDTELSSKAALRFETIKMDEVLEVMAGAEVRLVLLDACRDDPLGAAERSLGAGRGLAPVETAGASGTLIAFATAPGNVAADGVGRNSPFTEALLAHLATPGEDIRAVFGLVRAQVERATDRRQTPWVSEAISGRLMLVTAPAEASAAESAEPQSFDAAIELAFWDRATALGTSAAYRAYLAEFPDGRFAPLARLEIERLERETPQDSPQNDATDIASSAEQDAAGEALEGGASVPPASIAALEPSDAYPRACREGRESLELGADFVAEEWFSICLRSGELSGRDRLVALFDRGRVRLEMRKYDQALEDFDPVASALMEIPEVLRHRGLVYREKGLFDLAIADYDRAIGLDPVNAKPYHNRGDALQDQGEYDRAIADYDKAIALDPTLAAAYNSRGAAYHNGKGDVARAFAEFDKAISLDPKLMKAYVNRGRMHRLEGRYDEAIEDYDRALDLHSAYDLAYLGRGDVFLRMRRYDDAIADFDNVIRLDPKSASAFTNRAQAYANKGLHKRAVEDFSKAIELVPDDGDAYYQRGWSSCRLARPNQAISDYEKGVALKTANAKPLQEYLRNQGFYQGAIDGAFGPASRAALRTWAKTSCP